MGFRDLDYRFSDRKAKRGVAQVRIKSVQVLYGDPPYPEDGDIYGQMFVENGRKVEARMKVVYFERGYRRLFRYERVA